MALAETIARNIASVLEEKGGAVMALSGGSSPVDLYRALSRMDMGWPKVTITLVDDRDVPADHPDSNQRLLAENFFQHRAAAAEFIPLASWDAQRIPDLAILGMGEDGHFASLFPMMLDDPAAFDPEAEPAILKTGPLGNPPHPRQTMNLALIMRIPELILLIRGEGKARVLDKARAGANLPITRLLSCCRDRIRIERT